MWGLECEKKHGIKKTVAEKNKFVYFSEKYTIFFFHRKINIKYYFVDSIDVRNGRLHDFGVMWTSDVDENENDNDNCNDNDNDDDDEFEKRKHPRM